MASEMKPLAKAARIMERFTTEDDEPLQDARKLINKSLSRCTRVADNLDDALALLEKIRYTDWPTSGLGIGLTPYEIDEVLVKGSAALSACKRP
jgi:hypothetical protein